MLLNLDITDLDPQLNKQLADHFRGQANGFVQVGTSKCILPAKYRNYAAAVFDFKLRPDDIWLVSYPRSGTTVTAELLWLLANNLDYNRAATDSFVTRSPYLEHGIFHSEAFERNLMDKIRGDREKEEIVSQMCRGPLSFAAAMPSPRVIKTHLPFSLLPPKLLDTCKVVYVARNPRDVANSGYHFHQDNILLDYQGDFPTFWNYFSNGHVIYGPHWEHIAEAWQYRNHPNLHFQFYENIIMDMQDCIENISSHLGKHIDQQQAEKLKEYLSFENFRNNIGVAAKKSNQKNTWLPKIIKKDFVRKGKNNSWKEIFTPELEVDSERWIAEKYNTLPNFEFPLDTKILV